MKKIILESINISKSYNFNNKKIDILKNINLSVKAGEFIIIYGTSGSGKTTFLNIMSGLLKPSDGKVIISGRNYSEMEETEKTKFRAKNISYVFQNYGLIPLINVLDNVLLASEASGKYKTRTRSSPNGDKNLNLRKYAMEILKSLKIEHLANRFPSELSGGQQQRVSIARALVKHPLIIFADEPTGALDSYASGFVIEIFQGLAAKGYTIIMVTHDENLKEIADRIVYISNGTIEKIVKNEKNLINKMKNYDLNKDI